MRRSFSSFWNVCISFLRVFRIARTYNLKGTKNSHLVEKSPALAEAKGKEAVKAFGGECRYLHRGRYEPDAGPSRILTIFAEGEPEQYPVTPSSTEGPLGGLVTTRGVETCWTRDSSYDPDLSYDFETGDFPWHDCCQLSSLQFDKTFQTVTGTA